MESKFRIDGLRICFETYSDAEEFIKRYNKKYMKLIDDDKIEMLTHRDIKETICFETAEEAIKWGAGPDWWEV